MRCDQVVAAFNFDGTITTFDSLCDFVHCAVGSPRLIYGAICATSWMAGMLVGTCGRDTAKAHFLAATIGIMIQRELQDVAQQYVA